MTPLRSFEVPRCCFVYLFEGALRRFTVKLCLISSLWHFLKLWMLLWKRYPVECVVCTEELCLSPLLAAELIMLLFGLCSLDGTQSKAPLSVSLCSGLTSDSWPLLKAWMAVSCIHQALWNVSESFMHVCLYIWGAQARNPVQSWQNLFSLFFFFTENSVQSQPEANVLTSKCSQFALSVSFTLYQHTDKITAAHTWRCTLVSYLKQNTALQKYSTVTICHVQATDVFHMDFMW